MKRIYKSILGLFVASLLLVSCNDHLDKPPLDSTMDGKYWKTEEHVRVYAYGFYASIFPGYGSGITHGSFWLGQTLNDDYAFDVQTEFSPIRIPATDGSWNFQNIRRANYMLENVEALTALKDEPRNHWIGVSRLLRGIYHCNLSFVYGDIPYQDRVSKYNPEKPTKEELDYLFKDRDSRTYVAKKNIEDFRFALDNIREKDGDIQINKYVAAAYIARLMLREGTFLKYHEIDQDVATDCLKLAKEACEIVMAGPYKISDNYNALFSSEDLAGNPEVIIYRKYLEGVLMHSTLAYSNTDPQAGTTKSLLESYLGSNGLPIYYNNPTWKAVTSTEFFKNRDPRLLASFRDKYYIFGENNAPFAYSRSGYSQSKFMDDKYAGDLNQKFNRERNVTDAPCLRLGEVLVNYAEICYELGNIQQADLDISINLLRDRKGIEMPHLQIIGGQPAINNVTYDDPKRDPEVASLLWEIRRERRIELAFEGLRLNDLKRWKKLDYLYNGTNPDIRYGAYIRLSDYPNINKAEVKFENATATEGYILCNKGTQRAKAEAKNYVNPVPSDEIQLYVGKGYVLTQTKEWQNEAK